MPFGGVECKGRYFATLYGPDGQVKQHVEGDNVITSVGKEYLASFLKSAAAAASTFTMRYLAVGTDTTAESASDTNLNTEISRQSGIVSYVSNQIYQITATFATGSGTGAITEYGVFSSSSGGTLLSRDIESVINKGASDTLTVIYQMTLS